MSSTTDDLFKLIQDLVASRPLSVERVEKVTGHKLEPLPPGALAAPNRMFSSFRSESLTNPLVRTTDLRIPKLDMPGAVARDGFLSIGIQSTVCVSLQDVMARYGDKPELLVPSAHGPRTLPMGYVYRFPWGKLTFGISRQKPECLTSVTLDAV